MLLRLVAAFFYAAAVSALSAEELLSAPRRGPAKPNKSGTLALYFTSAYSFETHTKKSEWSVGPLDGAIEPAPLLGNSKLSSAQWLDTDDNSILFTNSSADGQTNVWILPHMSLETVYRAATIDGPVSNLKHRVVDDTIHLIFSSLAYPNGTLYNPKKAHKPLSSGRVYESLFVRHWDEYVKDEKSSLFFGTLSRPDKKAAYKLDSDPKNLLPAGYGLESPVPPFGGSDDFDLSPDGKTVAFVSKTPGLNPATNTQSLVYLVHTDSLRFLGAINGPDNVNSPAARGASSAPTFSPDNEAIAYLQMGENGYESDINKIYVVRLGEITTPVAQDWDVSPQTIKWDANAKHVYSIADHQGRHKLFKISVKSGATEEVWGKYTVSDYQLLPDGKFLLSINSLTQSSRSYILNPSDGKLKTLQEPVGFEKALRHLQVEEFWSPGAAGGKVHSYIVKPSFFDDTKKYKMAFFIHGGPQGSWGDSWSTRWNPTFFAEQGYISVAVNPTGSTGYGQKFTDAIKGQWGGDPYVDLEKAFEYLQTSPEHQYIDFENAVALGASYGGYMINYIQGKPLGRKFKALVCHDGVFSTLNQYTSEELYFPQHDFEGTLWGNRAGYEKWDPARLIDNWATPQMIIHSELDYRLPISEGLAAFNVLQVKGIPSKFLYFPDENHWVLKEENSLKWHNEVLEWIERWTSAPKDIKFLFDNRAGEL